MEINGYSGIQNTESTKTDNSSLSVQDFLKIMAAEIQNQNPMSGDSSSSGSKTDYLTQLAQFTTLDQMTSMANGINQLKMLNQVSLIGKQVTVYSPEKNIEGVVEKVKFYNSEVYIQIDNKDYPIGLLMEVENVAEKEQVELIPEVEEIIESEASTESEEVE
ncbi:MAG: flagellar hook capping FlgD N-terminal domain-containing protein [Gudongella sp.]|nr:flagellar hook capping FlgD N-terminal domain-containing protein [Gudongella sp.]